MSYYYREGCICGSCRRNHLDDYQYLYERTNDNHQELGLLIKRIEEQDKQIKNLQLKIQQLHQLRSQNAAKKNSRFPRNKFKKLNKRLKRLEDQLNNK